MGTFLQSLFCETTRDETVARKEKKRIAIIAKRNQGWCECNNNEMLFYYCGFNIPRMPCQLSNYADLTTGERSTTKLNPTAESRARDGHLKDLKMKDKRKAEKKGSKDDAHDDQSTERDESARANAKIKSKKEIKQSEIKEKKQ